MFLCFLLVFWQIETCAYNGYLQYQKKTVFSIIILPLQTSRSCLQVEDFLKIISAQFKSAYFIYFGISVTWIF